MFQRPEWARAQLKIAAAGNQDCDRKHVLIRRLSSLHELSPAEEIALLELLAMPTEIAKGQDIVVDGSSTSSISVILSGAASRYKMLAGGQRQILAFLLPGDIAEPFSPVLNVNDHGVSASTDCVIARMPRNSLERLMTTYPNLSRAIWRYCLVQSSAFQSWLVNMRRRPASERLAHLFCEQFVRLQAVGLAMTGKPVSLHIVQSDLADATGMSPVHVNRTLQSLRNRHLIGRNPNILEILDWEGLRELADFDPTYLHLRAPVRNSNAGERKRPESLRCGLPTTGSS